MKRNIDFGKAYASQHGTKEKKYKTITQKASVGFLIFCVAVTSIAVGVIKFQQYFLKNKAEAIEAFVSVSTEAQEYERLLVIQNEYMRVKDNNDSLDVNAKIIKKRPMVSLKAYNAINTRLAEGMELESITYTNGNTLSAVFSCPSSTVAADVVEAVRKDGFFSFVSYNDIWREEGVYYTQINCVLKEASVE